MDASIGILVGMARVLLTFLFSLVLLIRSVIVLVVVLVTAALPFAGV
jgi:hypothetical protein